MSMCFPTSDCKETSYAPMSFFGPFVSIDHIWTIDLKCDHFLVERSTENAYDAADKWLVKENLPLVYRQQVVEFILQNSGQKDIVLDSSFRDPFTGGEYFITSGATALRTIIDCWGCFTSDWFIFLCNHFHLFYKTANAYVPGEPSNRSGMFSSLLLKFQFSSYKFMMTLMFRNCDWFPSFPCVVAYCRFKFDKTDI